MASKADEATAADTRPAAFEARAALALANRIVIKIGTNTIMRGKDSAGRLCGGAADRQAEGIAGSAGGIDVEYLHRVAALAESQGLAFTFAP